MRFALSSVCERHRKMGDAIAGYFAVATSRTRVAFRPGVGWPFLAFAILMTIFPPATVNARTSWSIETSDAARSILATRGWLVFRTAFGVGINCHRTFAKERIARRVGTCNPVQASTTFCKSASLAAKSSQIGAPLMQRPCSTALLAIDAIANRFSGCVGIACGIHSRRLHTTRSLQMATIHANR